MRRILLFILLSIPFALRGQDNCASPTPLCATNSINGFYRMVVTVEDYHGNSRTEYGSWFENPSTPGACCP